MMKNGLIFHSAWGGVLVCPECGCQYSWKLDSCPNCGGNRSRQARAGASRGLTGTPHPNRPKEAPAKEEQ